MKLCSEAPESAWPAILAGSGLTGGQLEQAKAILAEMDSLGEGSPLGGPQSLRRIGGYRIVRKISEGGMGVVFEAEQDSPRRAVALKTLRPGQATVTALKRFEQEARALGRLNHPGIAQIYEAAAGQTPYGEQQYFAMELVDGLPLLEFAERNRLELRARIELVSKLCDAVQHAHELGIVHRDLKPSNILVTAAGQPKVLDFGVAGLAQGERTTQVTTAGELLGTLAYMSPEQVTEGSLATDCRTDVYAIGVMLYELAARKPPYELAGLHLAQAAGVICEREPEPLTAVVAGMPQDLSAIAGKALEKDREHRYQTVAELREDLARFNSDRPVLARPPSQTDQLRKFARRNRPLVFSLAAVVLILMLATAVSLWMAARARSAEATARTAERAALAERDRTRAAQQAAVESRDAAVRAQQKASEERDRAVAAEQKTRQERHRADQEAANATAVSNFLQNDLLAMASPEMQAAGGAAGQKLDPDLKVRTALDRAAAQIGARFPEQPVVEAAIRQTMGNTYLRLGEVAQARKQMETALDLRRRALGEEHQDTLRSMHNLAWLLQDQKQYAAAQPIQERVLAIRTRLLGEKHPDTIRAFNNLAGTYLGQMNLPKARDLLERLVPVMVATQGAEHPATLVAMNNLGVLSMRLGKFGEAETAHRRLRAVRERKLGAEHPDTLASANNLGMAVFAQGRVAEAEEMHRKTWAVRTRVLGEKHPQTLISEANLALALEARGDFEAAERLQARVYEIRKSVLGASQLDTLDSLATLSRLRIRRGQFSAAELAGRQALAGYGEQQKVWQRWFAQALVGQSLAGEKRFAEAAPLLTSGVEGLQKAQQEIPLWLRPFSLDLAGKWVAELHEALKP